MTVSVSLGTQSGGAPAIIDLEELLATRLLVQGNSGSGKSHLLRRMLEESAPWVQQVIIDPEGDFATLAEPYGHLVIEAADHSEAEIAGIALRVRSHRVSVVLNLDGLEVDGQLRCAAAFLNGLFGAPRDHWFPVLVVVDEAQLFAPAAGGETPDEARKLSLNAMTNLMCRGRKRGLAGVIATQRLAKLAKNVAAEASNFLMGRTFLDIDMIRAADLLGMERRQAEQIRDLERGQFMALGPALCRRPQLIRVGAAKTATRGAAPALAPLPTRSEESARELLFTAPPAPEPTEPAELTLALEPRPYADMLRKVDRAADTAATNDDAAPMSDDDAAILVDTVLAEIVVDPDAAFRAAAALYQDFTARCRMRGLRALPLPLAEFGRRLAMARAGIFAAQRDDPEWEAALALSDRVAEDMLGVFLRIARAAKDAAPFPTAPELAAVYGTHSTGRLQRLLSYMEAQGLIALRTDMRKRRSASIPALGWTTAPEDAMQSLAS